MSRILVVSPHPDDEAMGCGGTVLGHTAAGDRVDVVHLTSGEGGGHGAADPRGDREREAKAAAEILGLSGIEFWGERDGSLRVTPSLVRRLRERIRELRPDLIYVTHEREMHPDHRAAARLVRRAIPEAGATPDVLAFEVWTPIQTIDHIVDITPHMEGKLAAIRAYESQCAVMRFDDALQGLSRYRGEMHSWPGGEFAEVFLRIRP